MVVNSIEGIDDSPVPNDAEAFNRLVAFSQTEQGRKKARAVISNRGGPTYESDSKTPGLIIERRPDGSTRRGRFINRQFVPVR